MRGCENCKYVELDMNEWPCSMCDNLGDGHPTKWETKDDDYVSPNMDYKPANVEHNAKLAVIKLRSSYNDNDVNEIYKNSQEFVEAENIIINAILFHGYTLVKEEQNVRN